MSSSEEDDDYSGSEEDEYDEEDDDEEDDEEEDAAEEEAEPAAAVDVDQDLALIRECSARMDDTFARLLLRYPPARSTSSGRAGGSRPSAAGGSAARDSTRDGGGGPPRGGFGGNSRNNQQGGARYSRFAKHAAQLASMEVGRIDTPESERPPLSEQEHESRDALTARCVAEFARPDAADLLVEEDEPSLPPASPSSLLSLLLLFASALAGESTSAACAELSSSIRTFGYEVLVLDTS